MGVNLIFGVVGIVFLWFILLRLSRSLLLITMLQILFILDQFSIVLFRFLLIFSNFLLSVVTISILFDASENFIPTRHRFDLFMHWQRCHLTLNSTGFLKDHVVVFDLLVDVVEVVSIVNLIEMLIVFTTDFSTI